MSEEVKVKYRMRGISRWRTYYPDLVICDNDNKITMIEIKPSDQIENPNYQNRCKWYFADQYCLRRDWEFKKWSESAIIKQRKSVDYWKSKIN